MSEANTFFVSIARQCSEQEMTMSQVALGGHFRGFEAD